MKEVLVKSFEPEKSTVVNKYLDKLAKIKIGTTIVQVDPKYYRPTEVDYLIGNPQKAKEKLAWEAKTKFPELVKIMAKADFDKILKRGF